MPPLPKLISPWESSCCAALRSAAGAVSGKSARHQLPKAVGIGMGTAGAGTGGATTGGETEGVTATEALAEGAGVGVGLVVPEGT